MTSIHSGHHRLKTVLISIAVILFVAGVVWCGWLLRTDNAALTFLMARIVLIFTGCISLFLFIFGISVFIKIRRRQRH